LRPHRSLFVRLKRTHAGGSRSAECVRSLPPDLLHQRRSLLGVICWPPTSSSSSSSPSRSCQGPPIEWDPPSQTAPEQRRQRRHPSPASTNRRPAPLICSRSPAQSPCTSAVRLQHSAPLTRDLGTSAPSCSERSLVPGDALGSSDAAGGPKSRTKCRRRSSCPRSGRFRLSPLRRHPTVDLPALCATETKPSCPVHSTRSSRMPPQPPSEHRPSTSDHPLQLRHLSRRVVRRVSCSKSTPPIPAPPVTYGTSSPISLTSLSTPGVRRGGPPGTTGRNSGGCLMIRPSPPDTERPTAGSHVASEHDHRRPVSAIKSLPSLRTRSFLSPASGPQRATQSNRTPCHSTNTAKILRGFERTLVMSHSELPAAPTGTAGVFRHAVVPPCLLRATTRLGSSVSLEPSTPFELDPPSARAAASVIPPAPTLPAPLRHDPIRSKNRPETVRVACAGLEDPAPCPAIRLVTAATDATPSGRRVVRIPTHRQLPCFVRPILAPKHARSGLAEQTPAAPSPAYAVTNPAQSLAQSRCTRLSGVNAGMGRRTTRGPIHVAPALHSCPPPAPRPRLRRDTTKEPYEDTVGSRRASPTPHHVCLE